MLNINNPPGKALWSIIVLLCLFATALFLVVPADSLNTGLVYKGF